MGLYSIFEIYIFIYNILSTTTKVFEMKAPLFIAIAQIMCNDLGFAGCSDLKSFLSKSLERM